MIERTTGCIPDDHLVFDARYGSLPSSHALVGAASSLPSQALELANAMCAPARDQGSSSSCVGHALCRAADARLRVQGIAAPYGSPLAAYTLGRMLGRVGSSGALLDQGSYPRCVMQGAVDFGVALETKWPLWAGGKITHDLNLELPPDILQRASGWKIQGVHRIYAQGESAGQAAAAALAARFPIVACAKVDSAFMSSSGGDVIGPATSGPGHAVALVGYRTINGVRQFLVANSWTGWGLPGSLAWVTETWVAACFDLYVLTFELGPAAGGAPIDGVVIVQSPPPTSREIPNPPSEPFLPADTESEQKHEPEIQPFAGKGKRR